MNEYFPARAMKTLRSRMTALTTRVTELEDAPAPEGGSSVAQVARIVSPGKTGMIGTSATGRRIQLTAEDVVTDSIGLTISASPLAVGEIVMPAGVYIASARIESITATDEITGVQQAHLNLFAGGFNEGAIEFSQRTGDSHETIDPISLQSLVGLSTCGVFMSGDMDVHDVAEAVPVNSFIIFSIEARLWNPGGDLQWGGAYDVGETVLTITRIGDLP